MIYIHPDIMIATNRLGSYVAAPSPPAFKSIKCIACFLARYPHRPLMYPCGLSIADSHQLSPEVGPGEFHTQSIPNSLTFFANGGKGRSLTDKRAIACIMATLFGVAIHWKAVTQPVCAAHSMDSEVRTFYLGTKIAQTLRPIFYNLGIHFIDKPTPIYEDSQPIIDIIRSNHITSRVKHIPVPIHYMHVQFTQLTFAPVKINTTIQHPDIGTKAISGPLLECHHC